MNETVFVAGANDPFGRVMVSAYAATGSKVVAPSAQAAGRPRRTRLKHHGVPATDGDAAVASSTTVFVHATNRFCTINQFR